MPRRRPRESMFTSQRWKSRKSIRMPLEPTGRRVAGERSIVNAVNSLDVGLDRDGVSNAGIRMRQGRTPGSRTRSRVRGIKRLAAVVLVAVRVTGGVGGLATDAERAREADATRVSVVTELQATQTWNLVHGTPESTLEAEEE